MPTRSVRCAAALAAFLMLSPVSGEAQQQAAQAGPPGQLTVGPAVGAMAPDFEFQGITRFGILRDRAKLSDFRGQTVVLAFFPKARTKG